MDKDNNMYAKFGTKLSIAQDGKAVKYKSVKQFINTIPISKRKEMAKTYGITGYRGTAEQNQQLLDMVNKPNATTQQSELPAIPQQSLPANFIPGISKLPEQESFDIGKFLPKGPPKMFYVGTPEKLAEGVWDPVLRQYVAPELANVSVKSEKEPVAPVEYNPFSISPQQGPVDTSKKPSWWDAATMAAISAAPFLRRSSDQPLDDLIITYKNYIFPGNFFWIKTSFFLEKNCPDLTSDRFYYERYLGTFENIRPYYVFIKKYNGFGDHLSYFELIDEDEYF
jgi:hypothetical protein